MIFFRKELVTAIKWHTHYFLFHPGKFMPIVIVKIPALTDPNQACTVLRHVIDIRYLVPFRESDVFNFDVAGLGEQKRGKDGREQQHEDGDSLPEGNTQ